MAWREVRVMDQRNEFIETVLAEQLSMAEICRQYDISPKTGYKWLNRYRLEGIDGLSDKSRAPLKQALKTDSTKVDEILKVRFQFPTWGPKKVLAYLKRAQPDVQWPCTTTIGNLFDKNGLTIPRKLRRRVPGKTVPLSHCLQANDVWCADFKGWFLVGDGTKCEPFTLTDGATRFLLRCLDLKRNDVDHVWAVLNMAFHEFGLPIFFRSDNGPPFASCGAGRLSRLSVKLIKAGVIPEWIDPGKPEQNGRHERMHGTLKSETTSPPEWTLEKQSVRLDNFLNYYNHIRPHEGIGQITPGSIYSPSSREWKGRLKSPEYPTDYFVRKVKSCGKLGWKGEELYIARTLGNEPVGIKETDNGLHTVYYGPITLGFINHNGEFKLPEGRKRIRVSRRLFREAGGQPPDPREKAQ